MKHQDLIYSHNIEKFFKNLNKDFILKSIENAIEVKNIEKLKFLMSIIKFGMSNIETINQIFELSIEEGVYDEFLGLFRMNVGSYSYSSEIGKPATHHLKEIENLKHFMGIAKNPKLKALIRNLIEGFENTIEKDLIRAEEIVYPNEI